VAQLVFNMSLLEGNPTAPQTAAADASANTIAAAAFRDNHTALVAYARSLVRDEQAARDIVQDTFVRFCRKPPAPAYAKAWLFHVCRTRAVDWWRARREFTIHAANPGHDGVPANSAANADFFERLPDENTAAPGDALQHDETLREVFRHVDALPARQRELVRLKFQSGLSYKEIAETTGLTVTNVGFLLHTALNTLKHQLQTTLQ
jgi:RNA polymerase sigma-70 factor (ECF subfamily)